MQQRGRETELCHMWFALFMWVHHFTVIIYCHEHDNDYNGKSWREYDGNKPGCWEENEGQKVYPAEADRT